MPDDLKPLDFSMFSDRQLVDLLSQVYAEILKRRARASALNRQARLTEIGGPKYRNPENSAETWSGKGRMPTWVTKALAGGWTLQSLEIGEDLEV